MRYKWFHARKQVTTCKTKSNQIAISYPPALTRSVFLFTHQGGVDIHAPPGGKFIILFLYCIVKKICKKCGVKQDIGQFQKVRSRHSGEFKYRSGTCRLCKTEYFRDWREKNGHITSRRSSIKWGKNNPEKVIESSKRWGKKNQGKKNIHHKVQRAVKKGIIVKASNCENCGADGMLHGHHDDYSKPLKVRWLCPACHVGVHHLPPATHSDVTLRNSVAISLPL